MFSMKKSNMGICMHVTCPAFDTFFGLQVLPFDYRGAWS